MTARKLDKKEWKPFFDGVSKVLGVKQAEIEVLSAVDYWTCKAQEDIWPKRPTEACTPNRGRRSRPERTLRQQ
jgi:hypothetical protein